MTEWPGLKPTYNTGLRLAQIIHQLYNHPFGLNIGKLAEQFSVSPRTIFRYIKTLEEEFLDEDGAPLIETSLPSSTEGQIRFRRKSVKVGGAAYELMSLYLALDLMSFLDGTVFRSGAREVLQRLQLELQRSAGHETGLLLKDFHKKFLHWTEAPKDYSDQSRLIEKLVHALIRQHHLLISYKSPGKEARWHEVAPLSLLMYKRALYLLARKDDRELTFAVERIQAVQILETTFAYPFDYQPDARVRHGFGIMDGGMAQKIRIQFAERVAESIRSRRWHPTQDCEELRDGRLILSLTTIVNNELRGWILGYGSFAKVLEPKSLADSIRDELAETLAQYENENMNKA